MTDQQISVIFIIIQRGPRMFDVHAYDTISRSMYYTDRGHPTYADALADAVRGVHIAAGSGYYFQDLLTFDVQGDVMP